MPIFGQVWLWSSLAFLLGAVLCWLLVARPARNRVSELEAQLTTRARRQPVAERPEPSRRRDDEDEFSRSLVPGLGETRTEADSDYLTRSYALRETPPPLPEREREDFSEPELFGVFDMPEPPEQQQPAPSAAATQYLDVSAGSLTAPPEVPPSSPPPSDRGWFDDELEGDAANQAPEEQAAVPRNRHHMVGPFVDDEPDDEPSIGDALGVGEPPADEPAAQEDDEPRSAIEDDSGGTVFTQRTQPISRELIRQIDEAGTSEEPQQDALVDDLADDPEEPAEPQAARTVESEPVEAPETPAAEQETAVEEPVVAEAPPEEPAEQTEVVAAVREKSNELPRRVPMQSKMPGVAVRVDPTPNALPKRVPGRPRHQVPFGVQAETPQEPAPATPAAATTTAVAEEDASVTRSLFEPIVPAADEGTSTPPPPHRLRQASTGGRGPFGPGSAMPLPGGASPSPEFTIKASVAALRYCTPESPQFGRTVAEVWFRTAADAERVGFRPVG